MAKISGNEVRPGTMIEHQGRLWMAVKSQSVKPGKGGAYNQVELKDIESGTKLNERFRSSEMVEEIHLDKKDFQFLYAKDDMLTFMDSATFDQFSLTVEMLGEQAAFLQDNMEVSVNFIEGKPVGVKLPSTVILKVIEADPVVKGQTAASSYKPGLLENGLKVLIPPFIEAGTKIVVNTEDVSYVERAK